MAIIKNMWLRKSTKRLGGVVLYQAMEQTRARELASSIANPRTASQMGQRVKWANLVSFYRANSSWMKYAYETKTAQQSEYNKFMQLNVASSQIYLTKQQAAAGSAVVCPYIMTQGSLPSIEFTEENGSWPSNIFYPQGSSLISTTLVSEFSQKLIQQNPAIRQGDQLSFIRFTQMFNSDTGAPYVVVRRYEMLVDVNSASLVSDFLPLDYIGIVSIGQVPQLAVIDSGLAGGFVMILSRTQGGKTYVSSQRIITSRMDSTIDQFSSAQQLAAAISSYGETEDAFLSTTSANTNSQAPTTLAIIGVRANGTTWAPGSQVLLKDWVEAGDEVEVIFNGNLTAGTLTSITFATSVRAFLLDSTTKGQTSVSGDIPSSGQIGEGEYLSYLSVRFSDGVYTTQFAVPGTGQIVIGG